MELRLTADTIAKATSLADSMVNRRKVTLRELLSLIGLLSFGCVVAPCGRAFVRRLINLTIGIHRSHHYVTLSHQVRVDVHAWQLFLHTFKDNSLFLDEKFMSSSVIKLYSDASNEFGFTAVFGKTWVAGKRHRPFSSADITLLELCPLVLVTELFGQFVSNHSILFMTNNTGVVGIVNTTTSKNRSIMRLVRQLVLACLKYNILFRCKHVPGYQNVITGRLSRFQFVEARQPSPWLDVNPVIIPAHLTSHVLIP